MKFTFHGYVWIDDSKSKSSMRLALICAATLCWAGTSTLMEKESLEEQLKSQLKSEMENIEETPEQRSSEWSENRTKVNFTFIYTGKLYPKSGMAHLLLPVNLTEIFEIGSRAERLVEEARKVPIFEAFFTGSDPVTAGLLMQKSVRLNENLRDLEAELLGLAGIPKGRARERRGVNLNIDVGNTIGTILNGITNLFNMNEINRIKANQKHLVTQFDTLEMRIEDLENEVDEMRRRFVFVLTEVKWLATTTRLSETYDQAIRLVEDTTQAIVDLNNGILSTKLLTLAKAKEAHNLLQQQLLQSHLRLTFDEAIDLYNARTSWIVNEEKILEIVVHCPVFDQEGRSGNLKLYQWSSMPIVAANSTIEVLNAPKWVGISDGLDVDKNYVEFYDSEFEERCHEFAREEFICDRPLVLKKDIQKSCLATLLIEKVSKTCEFQIVQNPEPKMVNLHSGAIFLFFPERTEVAIICSEFTQTDYYQGVTRYAPTPGCRLETSAFTIPERVVAPFLAIESRRSVELSNTIVFGNHTENDGLENRTVRQRNFASPPESKDSRVSDIDIAQLVLIIFSMICLFMIIMFLFVKSRQLSA